MKLKTHTFVGAHTKAVNEQRHDWSADNKPFTGINVMCFRRGGHVQGVLVLMDLHPEHIDVEVVEEDGKWVKVRLLGLDNAVWSGWTKKPYVSKKAGSYCNTWGHWQSNLAGQLNNAREENGHVYVIVLKKDLF